MYKSDEDIKKEFNDFTIQDIDFKSDSSGWITIEFPEAGEHVGGGTDEVVDKFIIYDNGKIAFENWYPDDVYHALVDALLEYRDRPQPN